MKIVNDLHHMASIKDSVLYSQRLKLKTAARLLENVERALRSIGQQVEEEGLPADSQLRSMIRNTIYNLEQE